VAQIPKVGIPRRQTIVSDYIIDNVSSSISNSSTGSFTLTKYHSSTPSSVFTSIQSEGTNHVNLRITELTGFGACSTGSLTLAAGTTTSDLNGDTFTLIDKNASSQLFTFNNTDDVVVTGSIGLLSDGDLQAIALSIQTAINNVTTIQVTADNVVPSGGNYTVILFQDITGSDGNTTIDVSGVSGGSSADFAEGRNYGSGSFAASDSFSGTLKLRAISLKNQYLM